MGMVSWITVELKLSNGVLCHTMFFIVDHSFEISNSWVVPVPQQSQSLQHFSGNLSHLMSQISADYRQNVVILSNKLCMLIPDPSPIEFQTGLMDAGLGRAHIRIGL